MINFFKKYMSLISFLALAVVLWQFPTTLHTIFIIFLLFTLAIAISSVFKKNRKTYLQGKVTRGVLVWNVSVEILGILLAMTLAGLLGRIIAQVATEQISNDFTELIAGVVIGLLAGMGMGVLVKRTWGKFVRS
jgi:hypothetical protein